MKKHKKTTIIILILIIILGINYILQLLKSGTVSIDIPKGSSSAEIAKILKDNDIIQSKYYFLARLYLSSYRGKLQYGEFKIDKNADIDDILKTLSTDGAKKNTVTVTIPEGYSVEKIRDTLIDVGLVTYDEFEEALNETYDFAFLSSVPNSSDINYKIQGFLYPSTYEFYTDTDAKTIITKMLTEFEKQITPLNISNDKLFEIITKASMVEREAKLDSERAKIAGVFENRLQANMRLQIDATVVYAKTNGKYDINKVSKKDLSINSKYNTYKYDGLPVGPICSPSINSIKAALNPEKHNYLYYHTDTTKNDGSHIFTKSLEEHNETK